MERYLYTTRRYRWFIAAIVLILMISGSAAAYAEYDSTYESNATIWVSRTSQDLLHATDVSTDQPSVPNFLTPGSEYAELFTQLVQTQSFLTAVLAHTSLQEPFAKARDPLAFLDDVRKRFRIQALGSNLVRVTYRADNPVVAYEMVSAAITERDARAAQQQIGASSVTTAFYQKELDLAQQQAARAQQDLDKFNAAHSGTLSSGDDFTQRQLRLASDLAQVRLNDLKSQIDRTAISSALMQLTGAQDIQLIDAPQVQPHPSGGLRQAAFVFAVMLSGAVLLAALLVVIGTLLTASVASEADLGRLGAVTLLAAIPQFDRRRKGARIDLRTTLVTSVFGEPEPVVVEGAAS